MQRQAEPRLLFKIVRRRYDATREVYAYIMRPLAVEVQMDCPLHGH